ncbi:hypothetical protein L9F63_004962, partial [Diploptera punctata]
GSSCASGNGPPQLLEDVNNLVVSESTPVGSLITTVKANDPENSPVHFGIVGTDRFSVDKDTGEIRVAQPLDREVNDTIRFILTLEDEVLENGSGNNIVQIPVSVLILDENDNAPIFKNTPYEIEVPEDSTIGTTIFQGIKVEDPDTIGEVLEVSCSNQPQFPDACSKFEVVKLQSSPEFSNEHRFLGALVLKRTLDYSASPFYQLFLNAT